MRSVRPGGPELEVLLAYGGDFQPEEGLRAALEKRFPDLRVRETRGDEPEGLEAVRVCVGTPGPAQLTAMSRLEWIQLPSAGANGWPDRTDLPERVQVTTASGVFGVAAAEHVLALLLALSRRIPWHLANQREARWLKSAGAFEWHGRTVLVLGFGDIGRAVAARCHALGMRVLAVKRSPAEPPPFVETLATLDGLDRLLPEADAVVLALPCTRETVGLLSTRRLALLKPGAFLVNVGRGDTVDQKALVDALRSGRLGGAGLDVTEPEPLPQDHPLWRLENVVITSHSVNDSTRRGPRRVALLLDHLACFLAGRPLANLVDRRRGY